MRRFGEKLKLLRTQHKLTLKDLARELGYKAHGHISEIEAGKKIPTTGFALAVAEVFGVSVDSLLKDDVEIGPLLQPSVSNQDVPGVPFSDRPPSHIEFERFRLILSTYQDGTGMLASEDGMTLPGWRDFERSIALAIDGVPSESKDIFDVRLADPTRFGIFFAISCKMRRELSRIARDGRVTIELSNSSRKFWNLLSDIGINQVNYKQHPAEVGRALIELITEWHQLASINQNGNVDLTKSSYLALSWDREGAYQLHQFPLTLPDPNQLEWSFPKYKRGGKLSVGNHLNGSDAEGTLFEWYGESGGQLKYYPFAADAIWESPQFELEPLPADREHGVLKKVKEYFPHQWARVSDDKQSME